MDCISNVDLKEALMQIAQRNTFYHLDNDIKISYEQLEQAMKISDLSEKTLIWVSYPAGIDCYVEREVFQKDTSGYNGVLHHGKGADYEPKLTYAVEVQEVKDGSIYGNLYEIDIQEYAQDVKKMAVTSNAMQLFFDDVRRNDNYEIMPLKEFNQRFPLDLPKMVYWRNLPSDTKGLNAAIIKAHNIRLSYSKCSLWGHTDKLEDKRLAFHADKLIAGINEHKEPNSPDKQSFTTSLDAYVANNFGTEQLSNLLDKLPYENSAFTVQKGNRWNMNLVVPKNDVLALRQNRGDKSQKPSILGTLEANEQKVKEQFGDKSIPGKDTHKKDKGAK